MQPQVYSQSSVLDRQESAKVLRNTYALLAMTVLFSAFTAGIAMALGMGRGMGILCSIAAIVLVWFVLPRTANSAAGIGVVFAFTGLLGASLGLIAVLVCALGMMVASFFGVYMPMAQVVLSGVIALLFSGFILYDTSRIVNGGETNYIMATTSLYLNILNLFTALLHLFGFAADD
jgi:modulator of FtsH protease